MQNPKMSPLKAARRILRYLKALEVMRCFTVPQEGYVGYTDSDWGGNVDSTKSTSCYALRLGSGILAGSSKEQGVALSTG